MVSRVEKKLHVPCAVRLYLQDQTRKHAVVVVQTRIGLALYTQEDVLKIKLWQQDYWKLDWYQFGEVYANAVISPLFKSSKFIIKIETGNTILSIISNYFVQTAMQVSTIWKIRISDTIVSLHREGWRSGRSRLSWKQESGKPDREFESLSLRRCQSQSESSGFVAFCEKGERFEKRSRYTRRVRRVLVGELGSRALGRIVRSKDYA